MRLMGLHNVDLCSDLATSLRGAFCVNSLRRMRNLAASFASVVVLTVMLLPEASSAGEILGQRTWTDGNGHEYVLVRLDDSNWDEAMEDLRVLLPDFHLATITSQQENDFILSMLIDLGRVRAYWVGGFQDPITEPNPEAGWTWVTSEPWDYTNWASGEPNDANSPGREQHLAFEGFSDWNDEHHNLDGYIAELSNELPDCDGAVALPSEIWPPNHEMVPIEIVGVIDPDGEIVSVAVEAVLQNEPVGRMRGDMAPDAFLSPLMVRAERSKSTAGRIYHIEFSAEDDGGARCEGTVSVCVPHNAEADGCGGPLFDSTSGG